MDIVNALVITYNRLSLLKENLAALEAQTFPINRIIIVNNASTDGTADYLKTYEENPKYDIIHTEKNLGGAGGFALGLRHSAESGCDGTWLMDDDTIPTPTALKQLVEAGKQTENLGFCCSRVVNENGEINAMNEVHYHGRFRSNKSQSNEEETRCYSCEVCSFVSALISTAAVHKIGLPIKEFFIWADDVEYTLRISHNGMDCLYVPDSVAVHKSNTSPSIEKAPVETAWRFYYKMRNTSYIVRKRKSNRLIFYVAVLNKYRKFVHRLNRRTDGPEVRTAFMKELRRGLRDAFTFNPEIEFVEPKKN